MVSSDRISPAQTEESSVRTRRQWRKRRGLQVLAGVIGVIAVVVLVLSLVPAPTVWGSPLLVDQSNGGGLQSLSCASSSFCATFDWVGRLFVFDGHGWHRVNVDLVPGLAEPTDISCGAENFCMISNDAGDMFRYDGRSLTRTVLDARGGAIESVSCTSATFCGAVGSQGAYIYNGKTWSTFSLRGEQGTLDVISCVGRSYCAAGGASVATFDGRFWNLQKLPLAGGDEISQLSCATTASCVGISLNGDWVKSRFGSWRVMGAFGGGAQNQGLTPKMLSCPITSLCVAAATSGVLYELEGARWSRLGYLFRQSWARRLLEIIAPTPAVSLSCPTASVCVAVDGGGNSYFKRI